MNRVCLTGYITEPESQFTKSGDQVVKFRIGVRTFRKNDQGQYESDFFSVECWKKSAEFVTTYAVKGSHMEVDGRLVQDTWKDSKTGENRSSVKIVADSVSILDKKGEGPAKPEATQTSTASGTSERDPFKDDDELV